MPPSRPFSGRRRSSTAPSRPHRPEGDAVPQRLLRFGAPRRQALGDALGARAAGLRHGQRTHCGFRGVQIVAPRSITACAKSPARSAGISAAAKRRSAGLASGSGSARRRAAPSPARHCRRPASPRGRRRSRRSPPRCSRRCPASAQRRFGIGKAPAMALDDGAGAGMQVAGAGVVAEPLPGMQHLVERGRGQRRDRSGQRATNRSK